MYKVLNLLVFTKKTTSWVNPEGDINEKQGDDDAISGFDDPSVTNSNDSPTAMWELTSGNAIAAWQASGSVVSVAPPQATNEWSETHQPESDDPNADMENYCDIVSHVEYGSVTGIPTLIAHSVDWYAYAWINSTNDSATESGDINDGFPGEGVNINDFDDLGTGLQWRAWAKWHETSASKSDSHVTTEQLGNLVAPVIPDPPSLALTTSAGSWETKGYYVQDQICVIRWDVPGGLRFVD